jgi:hypothetical protein
LFKQRNTRIVPVPTGGDSVEVERFDVIKACEGYLASFEAQSPEETSPSYLHGWRMGRLGQGSFDASRKAHRSEPITADRGAMLSAGPIDDR